MDDFPALVNLFRPILHTLLLIWQHSKHYSSAPRLVALVRQISADLIQQARKFCPGERRNGHVGLWLLTLLQCQVGQQEQPHHWKHVTALFCTLSFNLTRRARHSPPDARMHPYLPATLLLQAPS
jgi:hypothetical protein